MNSRHLLVLICLLSFGCTPPSLSADLLQGEVHDSSQAKRIKRPDMPTLVLSKPSTDNGFSDRLHGLVDIGDFAFAKQMAKQPPLVPIMPNELPQPHPVVQQSEVDERNLIIAWEAWHEKVCHAIYENWLRCSQNLLTGGNASTSITVTKNHDISIVVQEVNVVPEPNVMFLPTGSKQMFATRVVESVRPLEGSSLLEFPAGSRRTEVNFTPNFQRGAFPASGYDWRHGDYERVPSN